MLCQPHDFNIKKLVRALPEYPALSMRPWAFCKLAMFFLSKPRQEAKTSIEAMDVRNDFQSSKVSGSLYSPSADLTFLSPDHPVGMRESS